MTAKSQNAARLDSHSRHGNRGRIPHFVFSTQSRKGAEERKERKLQEKGL